MLNDTQELKLVILAGGESSRLWPLHEKSMIRFFDKPLLEHQLKTFIEIGIRDITVVCSPTNRKAIEEVLQKFSGEIQYATTVQEHAKGMGDALLTLEPSLNGSQSPQPVLIVQVHDIVDKSIYTDALKGFAEDPNCSRLAAFQVEKYFPGGYMVLNEAGQIIHIVEKPGEGNEPPGKLVNFVVHIHPDLKRLLEAIKAEYASEVTTDDHYERAMDKLMKQYPFWPVRYPQSMPWFPIKYPWHVLNAMEGFFLERLEVSIPEADAFVSEQASLEPGAWIKEKVHISAGVVVEAGAYIKGPVYLDEGVVIETGVRIEGPVYIGRGTKIQSNARIQGPVSIASGCTVESGVVIKGEVLISENVRIFHAADIRGKTYIGKDCLIGQFVGVRGSMISQNCTVGIGSEVNRSYLGRYTEMHDAKALDAVTADSLEGKPTNLSALTVTYNLRIDHGEIKSSIKGSPVNTERKKLGTIIGSGSFLSGVSIPMPGIKVGENAVIGPGTQVLGDIADREEIYQKQAHIRKTRSAR